MKARGLGFRMVIQQQSVQTQRYSGLKESVCVQLLKHLTVLQRRKKKCNALMFQKIRKKKVPTVFYGLKSKPGA